MFLKFMWSFGALFGGGERGVDLRSSSQGPGLVKEDVLRRLALLVDGLCRD